MNRTKPMKAQASGSMPLWTIAFALLFASFVESDARAAAPTSLAPTIAETQIAEFPGSLQHVTIGKVSLPADGIWSVREPKSPHDIRELYFLPSEEQGIRDLGTRMYAALEKRHVERGRRQVLRGFEACRSYAQKHGGRGPNSIEDLVADKQRTYIKRYWESGYWGHDEIVRLVGKKTPDGPFVHLVSNVSFDFEKPSPENTTTRKRVLTANRNTLAFELRPLIDDGKHWVLYTDGSCERQPIDPKLLSAENVTVIPVLNSAELEKQSQRPTRDYTVVMVTQEPFDKKIMLSAFNQVLGETIDIQWDAKSHERVSYDDVKKTSINRVNSHGDPTWQRGPAVFSMPGKIPAVLAV